MEPLLQQLPALIGVVIGAVGSYLGLTIGDRARFAREQAAQWRERRLSAYSEYSRALKGTVSVTLRLSAHLGNESLSPALAPDDADARLGAAYDVRDIAWEALLLVGAPEVVEAARTWFLAAARLESFVRDQVRDPDRWSVLLAAQREARAAFYAAARRDVGLPPGFSGQEPAVPTAASAT